MMISRLRTIAVLLISSLLVSMSYEIDFVEAETPSSVDRRINQPIKDCTLPNDYEGSFWEGELSTCQILLSQGKKVVLPGLMETIRVIIQIQGDPISLYKTKFIDPSALSTDVKSELILSYSDRLESAQNRLIQEIRAQNIPISVHHTYDYLLNGIHASVLMKDVSQLEAFQGVKGVFPDYVVHTLLNESVPLIGADQVWLLDDSNGQNVTGIGIEVAIIDTGIDYTHPDLGGSFGPGNKVAGGYDFVNDDPDPFDDYGHGTHVAGIVAANGTLKGVAPEATLFAYKVLDNYGYGYTSDIISALEMSANPDSDPITEDAHDVVNLSLGGPGSPNDPLSQAVTNAVQAGVLVAAAAGNSGPDYWSIGSPGGAQAALTVGATDKSDTLANFSSRGPIRGHYDIVKPDILAPGVNIYSTVPLEGRLGDPSRYAYLNGTSMATPHIAGAAALIKQLHPDWTPEMIRAGLVNYAVDLDFNIFQQGSGRVQILETALGNSLVDPSLISFGKVDLHQSTWTSLRTFLIRNISDNIRNYTLQLEESLPEGASITVTPANLTLSPGESQVIQAELTIDNDVLPIKNEDPYAYEANLSVISESEMLPVKFAFFNTPVLNLSFDKIPMFVIVLNENYVVWQSSWGDGLGINNEIMLPQGVYDVIVNYQDGVTQVIKEEITVETETDLTIQKTDAIHTVNLKQIDKDGNLITRNGSVQSLQYYKSWVIEIVAFRINFTERLRFSDISSDYFLGWTFTNSDNVGPVYDFFYSTSQGLSEDIDIENTPSDLIHITQQYFPAPGVEGLSFIHMGWAGSGGVGFWDVYGERLKQPFIRDVYLFAEYNDSIKLNYDECVGTDLDWACGGSIYQTPRITAKQDGRIEGYIFGDESPVFSTTSRYLPIGLGPPHWFGSFDNQELMLGLHAAKGWDGAVLFRNQTHDLFLYPELAYQLYREGELIQTGELPAADSAGYYALETELPEPSGYSFQTSYPYYYIFERPGVASLTATFDTRISDKNPPILLSLNVLFDSIPANSLPVIAENKVTFSVRDDSQLSQVSLSFKTEDSDWQGLSLINEGESYTALLPDIPTASWVDLMIKAVDASGNRLKYEVQPAFVVQVDPPRLQLPQEGSSYLEGEIQFTWESVPYGSKYSIQIDQVDTFDSPNLISETVSSTALFQVLSSGIWYWRAKAQDSQGNESEYSPPQRFLVETLTFLPLTLRR